MVLNATIVMVTNGSNQSVVTVTLGTNITGSFNNSNNSNTTLNWTTDTGASNANGNVVAATITESPAKRNF